MSKHCRSKLFELNCSREKSILSSGDLGKFYRYVNSKLCCKSGVAPIKDNSGNLLFDHKLKAEYLNNYFASVCSVDNNILPDCTSKHTSKQLCFFQQLDRLQDPL